ncbi:MAG: hypothetical protein ACFB0B_00010 [Thermonemataceae bacterium]
MKLFTTWFYIGSLWFFVFGLVGCGDKSTSEETDETTAISDSAAQVAKENVAAAIKQIPPPSEIPALLQASGAEFEASLVNDLQKAEGYITNNTEAALNLGIYATDLGYVVIHDKTQQAIDYIQASRLLTDKLGITATFDDQLVAEFQENLDQKDTLVSIVDKALQNVDLYLRDNQRAPAAALILAGTFVEGMYISAGSIRKYPAEIPEDVKNATVLKLIDIIIRQKTTLRDVINSLEAIQRDEKAEAVLTGLKEMETIYEQLNLEEKIAENQGDLMVTETDLAALFDKVEEVRKTIVG